jgi:hypothetical protein
VTILIVITLTPDFGRGLITILIVTLYLMAVARRE